MIFSRILNIGTGEKNLRNNNYFREKPDLSEFAVVWFNRGYKKVLVDFTDKKNRIRIRMRFFLKNVLKVNFLHYFLQNGISQENNVKDVVSNDTRISRPVSFWVPEVNSDVSICRNSRFFPQRACSLPRSARKPRHEKSILNAVHRHQS